MKQLADYANLKVRDCSINSVPRKSGFTLPYWIVTKIFFFFHWSMSRCSRAVLTTQKETLSSTVSASILTEVHSLTGCPLFMMHGVRGSKLLTRRCHGALSIFTMDWIHLFNLRCGLSKQVMYFDGLGSC
jgi:hypothetical protein